MADATSNSHMWNLARINLSLFTKFMCSRFFIWHIFLVCCCALETRLHTNLPKIYYSLCVLDFSDITYTTRIQLKPFMRIWIWILNSSALNAHDFRRDTNAFSFVMHFIHHLIIANIPNMRNTVCKYRGLGKKSKLKRDMRLRYRSPRGMFRRLGKRACGSC